MRSSTSLALFAASAAAQSMSTGFLGAGSATVFNLFEYAPTLTLLGSDATATTYKNDCPSGGGLLSTAMSGNGEESASAMITPAPKHRAMFARQAMSSSPETDAGDVSICEPYTIKQGASTWEMHLTDPSPGVWTADMNCNWSGAMTAAALTCTAVVDGSYVAAEEHPTSTYVISEDTVSSFAAMATVAVVDVSGKPLSSFPTASGSAASGSSASVSRSGAAANSPSTGFAPAGPLPTGAMALVGGAAGVFAALAL